MIRASSHEILDSHPQSPVRNSQTPGIGRLSIVGDCIAVNNLGRNIVFLNTKNGVSGSDGLHPRAYLCQTFYPDDDEKSQFDLDMHSILLIEGKVLAINHYGLVRMLALPGHGDDATTTDTAIKETLPLSACLKWPGDVERFSQLGSCLLSTSAQGYAVPDPVQPGLLISSPLGQLSQVEGEIPYRVFLEDWGILSALAVDARLGYLAVAHKQVLAVFQLTIEKDGCVLPGSKVWQSEVDFDVRFITFAPKTGTLICAGHDRLPLAAAAEDWDSLQGGGWHKFESKGGKTLSHGRFDAHLAWGNGGETLLLWRDEKTLMAVDKWAGLHAIDTDSAKERPLLEPRPRGETALGLAHITRQGDSIYCGFNRDGYRLHRFRLEPS